VSFYTASFSAGSALSYFVTGLLAEWLGWRSALALLAVGPAVAMLMIWVAARAMPPGGKADWLTSLDFRPAIRHKRLMAYVWGYAFHTWETVAMRSFLVAFIAFAAAHNATDGFMAPSALAMFIILLGLPASLLGNELCIRFGRRRTISTIMMISLAVSAGLGLSVGISYWVAIAVLALYGLMVTADSSSLTAGAVANSPEGSRGAAMALHSFMGFGGGAVGPVAAGIVLDLSGGPQSVTGWAMAFLSMGLASAVAALLLRSFAAAADRQAR
jgi:MFS family permease